MLLTHLKIHQFFRNNQKQNKLITPQENLINEFSSKIYLLHSSRIIRESQWKQKANKN